LRIAAPCILYASLKIQKENPDAVMIVAPSDHWIEDEAKFTQNVQQAFDFCENNDALMTLGIQPSFPNTGYGYIEFDKSSNDPIKPVQQFREKPDYETAKSFIKQGNFLWNAGIFMWSAKSVVKAFQFHQPQLFELFENPAYLQAKILTLLLLPLIWRNNFCSSYPYSCLLTPLKINFSRNLLVICS